MNEDLDDALCHILFGWDVLERSLKAQAVIDFNLIRFESDRRYDSRNQVRDDLSRLYEQASRHMDGPFRKRFLGRIYSFITYIDECQSPGHLPQREYIRRVTGLDPQRPDGQAVSTLRQKVQAHFDAYGIPFDENGYTVMAYETGRLIPMQEAAIRGEIQRISASATPEIDRLTGRRTRYDLDIQVTRRGSLIGAWISGQGRGFHLDWNANPAAAFERETVSLSRIRESVNHEICGHAEQFARWLDEIEAGRVPRSFGITTVLSQEVVLTEAIAESIGRFLAEDLQDPHYSAYLDIRLYLRTATGYTEGVFLDEGRENAVAEGNRLLDIIPAGYTGKRINAMELDPHQKFYLPVYAQVKTKMCAVMDYLGHERFGTLLARLYPQWLDVDGLNAELSRAGCPPSLLFHTPAPPATNPAMALSFS